MELIVAMEGNLGSKIMAKLEKEEYGASHYWCIYVGDDIFEVECPGRQFAINVEGRT